MSRKKGVKEIIVLSDPNAQSFYEKYGFKKFKEEETNTKKMSTILKSLNVPFRKTKRE